MQPHMVQPAAAKGALRNLSSPALTESIIDGKSYVVSKIMVHAPAEEVWRVLTDYPNAHKVFPQMKKCQVVKDEGSTKLIKHTVAPSGPVGTYTYTVRVKETAPHSLEWTRVSGAFKDVKGYWKLEKLDGGRTTMVTYASFVDGGFLLPQPLIKRQCRMDMPNVMSCLKQEVEQHMQHIAEKPKSSSTNL